MVSAFPIGPSAGGEIRRVATFPRRVWKSRRTSLRAGLGPGWGGERLGSFSEAAEWLRVGRRAMEHRIATETSASRDTGCLCRWTTRHRSSRALDGGCPHPPGRRRSSATAARRRFGRSSTRAVGLRSLYPPHRVSAGRGYVSTVAGCCRRTSRHHDRLPLAEPGPHTARSYDPARAVLASSVAINDADKRGLTDPEALRGALDSYRGRPRGHAVESRGPRSPYLQAHRLRARASIPAARARCGPAVSTDAPAPEWVQGRFLLA